MGCAHGKCRHNCRTLSGDEDGFGAQRIRDLEETSVWSATIPSHNMRLEYAFLTRRGHYPDSPEWKNQDSLCIRSQLQGNPNLHFFGVFDGHGVFGSQCSNFVKERLVDVLSHDSKLLQDPVHAYTSAFLTTNTQLHEAEIDDSRSGTTAITVLVRGNTLYVANAGDSRAVAGIWNGSCVNAEKLSSDQTPVRNDEYERVKQCGATVLSMAQINGREDPSVQYWGTEEDNDRDPPRLWYQDRNAPGLACTRSLGDSDAEKIGATADPEVLITKITPDHLFFVVASDGVFDFLSSQDVVNMVAKYNDPHEACLAIVDQSCELWLKHARRIDDITIIVVHIKHACNV